MKWLRWAALIVATVGLVALAERGALGAPGDIPVKLGRKASFQASRFIIQGPGAGQAKLEYANSANTRTYTYPDAGANANVLLTEGANTVGGAWTYTGVHTFNHGKFALRDTANDNSITIQSAGNETADRTLTVPLLGANDTAMTLGTAQSVTGVKTFNDGAALLKAGNGTATFLARGVLNLQHNAVGTGADTTEITAHTYTLPANSLSANGKAVRVRAWGTTAANANNKTWKLQWGGTDIYTTGAVAANAKNWAIEATIIRTAAGAQDIHVTGHFNGALITASNITTATENEATDLAITSRIQNGTASANDIVEEGFIVEFLP